MTGAAIRCSVHAWLAGLPALMQQAIDGEHDETCVHYLLSDIAHGALTTLDDAACSRTMPRPAIGEHSRRGVRTQDLLTVTQWAERHGWLVSGTNAPRFTITPRLSILHSAPSNAGTIISVMGSPPDVRGKAGQSGEAVNHSPSVRKVASRQDSFPFIHFGQAKM